jgi:N-acyl-D-amino-acid deacylase
MTTNSFDMILRGGTIYNGSGEAPFVGDVAINGDAVAAVGSLGDATGQSEIDVAGLAVAPGFINILSHATISLIEDGKSQSNIRQGVTLEVMGEGSSAGPLTPKMKEYALANQGDITYDITWETLGGYLEHLVERGVSTNVASFLGAATARVCVLNHENRPPSTEELEQMCEIARQAMREGAVGVSSALIYAPGSYASTEELTALAGAVAEYDGVYVSHIRSESAKIMEALEEFLTIVKESGARGEVYHLKFSGPDNWHRIDEYIEKFEAERAAGLPITADMYTYIASATGLKTHVHIPNWAEEGGHDEMIKRLKDPEMRAKIKSEMFVRDPSKILLLNFKNDALKHYTGKTFAQVIEERGGDALDCAIDLIIEDDSRIGSAAFNMCEENVKRQIALPWVCFGSDGGSMAPEGNFLKSSTHPRSYGTFARVLGKYVREEKVIPLEEAVRKLAALPADTLKIERRGRLLEGNYADIAIFDPETIIDNATFQNPQQYATGMVHVFVNGTQVLKDGEHTGEKPGRVVRGPGYKKQ